jgi:hypothetical protein
LKFGLRLFDRLAEGAVVAGPLHGALDLVDRRTDRSENAALEAALPCGARCPPSHRERLDSGHEAISATVTEELELKPLSVE